MPFSADLHIHSRFARACSKDLNLDNLAKWSKYKGIEFMGTGDCLHPQWLEEISGQLKAGGSGLYTYNETTFLLTTEVSCIYKEKGQVYRIHILIFLPSLESCHRLAEVLRRAGQNLTYDGRPIFGLSAKKLCELVFNASPEALIMPAHVWTPWFSLYGTNSGYELLTDCFGEFSNQIYAIETGLSSEPAMNWRKAELDTKSIVSFSDAHSLPRLGRELTVFEGPLSFEGLTKALQNQHIIETIEFFPEEGKYHYSGHRNCKIVYSPEEARQNGMVCPICKRKLTPGVMQRVEDLASRNEEELELIHREGVIESKVLPHKPGFRMLVQLEEIIAEAVGKGVRTKTTQTEYLRLVENFDNELNILTKRAIPEIARFAGERIAEGVQRVREGKVTIKPGFDNTYGVVKIFE